MLHLGVLLVAATCLLSRAEAEPLSMFECGLPNVVPPEFRRNITLRGVSMALGISPMDWSSGRIVGKIAAIIASHVLGIHTVVHDGASSSLQSVAAVAGCTSQFNDDCEVENPSRRHATFEVWSSSLQGHMHTLRSFLGSMTPDDLGSVGYDGVEGFFVSGREVVNAQAPLEYFRSYNVSWHTPSAHFDKISDVPEEGLLNCSETLLFSHALIERYLSITNDIDGVEVVNGIHVAKCLGGASGKWWLAPACRQDPDTCVPVITSGTGWSIDIIQQRAGYWNMPLALATASWRAYVEIPRTKRVMYFWWTPDTTFIDLSPVAVRFPSHDSGLWDVGNRVTDSKAAMLGKWGNPSVLKREPRLKETFKALRVSEADLRGMLLENTRGKSEWEAACDWLKASGKNWQRWVPVVTLCQPGWGLVDMLGQFVQNVTDANSCVRCPTGMYSQEAAGQALICVACPAGRHQPSEGQTSCLPCPMGAYANISGASRCYACPPGAATASAGSSACAQCAPGSYQSTYGLTACEFCIGGTFQGGAGATTCQACRLGEFSHANAMACRSCAPGRFSSAPGRSECQNCPLGHMAGAPGLSACSSCPIGSYSDLPGSSACVRCGAGAEHWTTMRKLRIGLGEEAWVSTDAAQTPEACGCDVGAHLNEMSHCVRCVEEGVACTGMGEVVVLPGYYASSAVQISVFSCRKSIWCPGGPPGGSCAPGRQGLACARCPAGQRSGSSGSCEPCDDLSRLPFAMGCLGAIATCIMYYRRFEVESSQIPTYLGVFVGACGSLTVSLFQQLSAVGILDIKHAEPLHSFLELMKVFSLDLRDTFVLDCLGVVSPGAEFGIKVGGLLGLGAFIVAIHLISVALRHRGQFRKHKSTLLSALGTLGMIFYTLITVTILEPFHCVRHPNGEWTLGAHREVMCSSSESHFAMLAISLVAMCISALFLGMIVWLVLRLPQAIRDGDREFLRSYRFLFFRFRPKAYWYGLVILARGLFTGLVFVVPNAAIQIALLEVVMLCSFIVSACSQAWRHRMPNVLETIFNAKVLDILYLSAILSPSRSSNSIGWTCIVLLLLTASLLPALLLSAIFKRVGALEKRFHFFLCHTKSEAAAFARWLKLEILVHPGVSKDVFLDTDNLESLDRLLLIVSADVDILVALCTQSIFGRPWCVGEMVTAHRNSVSIAMLAFPGFKPPQLEEACMIDMTCLRENGIQDHLVCETLETLVGSPALKLLEQPGLVTMRVLVSILTRRAWADESVGTEVDAVTESSIVIVVDVDELAAYATANVIRMLLARFTFGDLDDIPRVLRTAQELPPCVDIAIIVLTQGCLVRPCFMSNLIFAAERRVRLLAVVADHFEPPKWHELVEAASRNMLRAKLDLDQLAHVAKVMLHGNMITIDLKKATSEVLDTFGSSLHDCVGASCRSCSKERLSRRVLSGSGRSAMCVDSELGRRVLSGWGRSATPVDTELGAHPVLPATMATGHVVEAW